MNDYFKKAGDLNDDILNITGSSYFKKAGDLNNYIPKGNTTLPKQELSSVSSSIKNQDKIKNLEADINKYIRSIVSGKKYESVSDFGTVISAGSIIVPFSKLREMVEEGCYNFISATYINPKAIAIEFQQIDKTIGKTR